MRHMLVSAQAFSLSASRMFCAFLLGLVLAGGLPVVTLAVAPAPGAFERTWARTDRPVADGTVARTWMWGPQANTGVVQEPYVEAPGGMRQVQYFDKARMEITDPNADEDSIWFVTNGLLVVELITGRMQVGDASFEARQPAAVNVAGDGNDPTGPQYATFASLLDAPPHTIGSTIVQRVDRNANVTDDPSLASQNVTVAYIDTVTNHAIAEPFWTFMNSSGIVYEGGQFVTSKLFENPFFATGRPVTEAYWAEVLVAGTPRLVLMQCFERRCLTYTPGNPEGFVVEAGNVGLHYYTWRYGQAPSGDGDGTDTGAQDPTEPMPEPATRYSFAGKWGQESAEVRLSSPYKVATAPSGDVYVTDSARHQVLRFSSNGILLTAWGGEGSETGKFKVPAGIDVDKDGYVYVADFGNRRIQKFDANGAFITSWDTDADGNKLRSPYGLAIGPDDAVYVTDVVANRVHRFLLNGQPSLRWGRNDPNSPDYLVNPHGIDVSPSGLVYVADTLNKRVRIFDGAGNPQGSFGSEGDGTGQFRHPVGISVAADGAVYVSDLVHDRVQIFTIAPVIAPAEARALAAIQYKYAGMVGEAGAFNNPIGLEVDANGRILVADTDNHRLQIFARTGIGLRSRIEVVDTWIDDSRARFQRPHDLAVGLDGRVYVADHSSGDEETMIPQVQVFSQVGAYLSQWRDILAGGITVDSQGNLYLLNLLQGRVEKYSPDGQLLDSWGPGDAQARILLNFKLSLAVDGDDNLYILEGINGSVQKYSPDGTFLYAWGAPGSQPGQFKQASGIAIYGDFVYVADTDNNRVQVFDRNGTYLRQWGSPGSGPGQFNAPHGIAVDAYGYVYVTETGNHRVQKFTPDGEFLAQIGREGNADGQFRSPTGIALDAAGNVYVVDSGNFRIQKFQPVD